VSYTAEVLVDSTNKFLGEFVFGTEPRPDYTIEVDGKDYIIVGTTEKTHPDADVDYEVRVMPDHYGYERRGFG